MNGSKVALTRTRLHDALAAALEPTPWRAWRTPPANIAVPCLFIGSAEFDVVEPRMVLRLPVVAAADGADRKQVEALDELQSIAADCVLGVGGIPRRSFATRLDVGGPTLRAVEITAEFTLSTLTLCVPILEEVAS